MLQKVWVPVADDCLDQASLLERETKLLVDERVYVDLLNLVSLQFDADVEVA